jgi:hypothetical protein
MPSALPTNGVHDNHVFRGGNPQARPRSTEPLSTTGLLDGYTYEDITPVIGREFTGLQVVDLLKASNSDDLIRDLAVTGNSPRKFPL